MFDSMEVCVVVLLDADEKTSPKLKTLCGGGGGDVRLLERWNVMGSETLGGE